MNFNSLICAAAETCVTVSVTGKTASAKKLSAVDSAIENGSIETLRVLARKSGKVGKAAKAGTESADLCGLVEKIAIHGDLAQFGLLYAATTGMPIKFGIKNEDGTWKTTPSEHFRATGVVLDLALFQLQEANKAFNSKGQPSTAAVGLQDLIIIHTSCVRLMDAKRDAAFRARQARMDAMELSAHEDKTAVVA